MPSDITLPRTRLGGIAGLIIAIAFAVKTLFEIWPTPQPATAKTVSELQVRLSLAREEVERLKHQLGQGKAENAQLKSELRLLEATQLDVERALEGIVTRFGAGDSETVAEALQHVEHLMLEMTNKIFEFERRLAAQQHEASVENGRRTALVKQIQQELARLQCYFRPVDGVFGHYTNEALAWVGDSTGERYSGDVISPSTLSKLKSFPNRACCRDTEQFVKRSLMCRQK